MVELHLAEPPDVASIGAGIHGVRRLREVFRLPDLWQLHLYSYSAELTVAGTTYSVAPGYVSLTPAGAPVEFVYRGRSEHLYVHFRPRVVGEPSFVPVVQDAGSAAPVLSDLLRSALERMAGVSHNHLTRLFHAETGLTVIAYIRQRRMARARHLLVSSTLSIPAVAASVGISDLQ